MAKIIEQTVTIKVSKLVRDDADASGLVSDEFVMAVEAMASEIIEDPAAVVEVTRNED